MLTTQDESGTNLPTPRKFQLTGDRETLKALKKHSGHFEEVTGTVKRSKRDSGYLVKEKRIDKGRVYVGSGAAPIQETNPVPESSLRVRAFAHVNDRCS